MQNNRDDQYHGSDEGEYHFSDDESHYESDSGQSSNQPQYDDQDGDKGKSILRSRKKVIIIAVVFVVLASVVYKLISPGATIESTNIQSVPVVPSVAKNNAPVPEHVAQVAATPEQPVSQQPSVEPVAATAPANVTATPAQPSTTTPEVMAAAPSTPAPQAAAPEQPNVIPVGQPAMPTTVAVAPSAPPTSANAPVSATPDFTIQTQTTDPRTAQLEAENAKLSNQLQAEYMQRLTEYQNQNKNIEQQVQALSTRVATMESEMSQLIQTLTQQFQAQNAGGPVMTTDVAAPGAATPTALPASAPMPEAVVGPAPRVPYNVQAIIPGRAWLRSNNGDVVTVAEGDVIKGIGKVQKIDPYDGVVEINVNGRVVSLSYGNGT